jgi:hypothetical protein
MKKDSYKIREEMMKGIGKLLLSESEIEEGIRFVLKEYEDIIVILWKKALSPAISACNSSIVFILPDLQISNIYVKIIL